MATQKRMGFLEVQERFSIENTCPIYVSLMVLFVLDVDVEHITKKY